ncbi:MAG: dihydrolipoamide acetyltransferase [Clostridiales bacterium]|nr:MAG: dihydrolipoamide acetyltransferase [Clostridiales bacterium]
MANVVIMPRQGQSVESCIITSWEVNEGDFVNEGDVLFTYETDKTAFEETSKFSGVLLKQLVAEGDDVPVLDDVAIIGEAGEDISGLVKAAPSAAEPAKVEAAAPVQAAPQRAEVAQPVVAPAQSAVRRDDVNISPRAKRIATEMGLDYGYAEPTGPNDRIIERDIMRLAQQPSIMEVAQPAVLGDQLNVGGYSDIALSTVRKAIAKSMHHSLASMAQLTHSFSFDATQIINYRKQLKANAKTLGLNSITYNDIILYAVARVLLHHPDLNAHFLDDKMRLFDQVNLGMAVDTPRGLLVPTIYGADKLSLNELSAQTKQLASGAQAGTISPDLLKNATFTVSNLGTFGVEHFTPVINPPQVGIIGVNNMQVKFKMVDGEAVPYQAMGLSLTYDHRAIDGAPASRFMQELCNFLENFTVMLAR